MRHGNSYRKLGRDSQHRRALLRNMTTSFFEHGKVKTTVPKAKELRCIVEKMITLGKAGDLHSRRQAASYLFSEDALKRLFSEVSGRFATRQGGYTRIVKYGPRFGDGAEICQLELVDYWDHEGKASQEAKKIRLERKQKEAESKETTVVE